MVKQINNLKDVLEFAQQLVKEGTSFHPDDDFNNYINRETQQPVYSKAEANLRNDLVSQCFSICREKGIDIYDTMSEVVLLKTGLDKFIPLPSVEYKA